MPLARAVWNGWKARSRDIGEFQSRLLLTVFYFTVFVPFALPMRLFADPLRLRRHPADTAWRERPAGESALEAVRRQF